MLEDEIMNAEARTAVVGVGGAGCNIISNVFWDLPSVDTIAVNTDKEALLRTDADKKIFICKAVTNGFGANGDSMVGKRCAQAHLEDIKSALSGYDAVFIVSGMGGGTGTGASPVIAEIAQSMNCIVSAIVTDPFSFETSRSRIAKEGIAHMRAMCPMTVVIENDMILEKMPGLSMEDAFRAVNRSISSYIARQIGSIESAFRKELDSIGQYAEDAELPTADKTKGLVTN